MSKRLEAICKFALENREEFQLRFDDIIVTKVIIYPIKNENFYTITPAMADRVRAALGLVYIPGYRIYPCTGIGGCAYVFPDSRQAK